MFFDHFNVSGLVEQSNSSILEVKSSICSILNMLRCCFVHFCLPNTYIFRITCSNVLNNILIAIFLLQMNNNEKVIYICLYDSWLEIKSYCYLTRPYKIYQATCLHNAKFNTGFEQKTFLTKSWGINQKLFCPQKVTELLGQP